METASSSSAEQRAAQYASDEAHFNIIPVLKHDRVWGMRDYILSNVAFAIATWCFITGGYLAYVVPFSAGTAATIFGLFLGYGLIVFGGSLGSCKYGIDLYQQVRSSFGCRAASYFGLFIALLNVLLNLAIIYPMLGKALTNILAGVVPMDENTKYWCSAIVGIVGLLATWVLVYKGPIYMKVFNNWVSPSLIFVLLLLVFFLAKDKGWNAIFAAAPSEPSEDSLWNYTIAIEWNLGFAFSWWWLMGAIARITKTQRVAALGFVVGTAFPAALAIIVGMMSALVVKSPDPTEWLIPIAGRGFGVVALIFIAFANISSGALLAYSGGLACKNIQLLRKWSWKAITFMCIFPAIILMIFQNIVYDNLGTVLALFAVTLAPLTAIVWVDYSILRKQNLDLRAIYDTTPTSPYYFWKGINPAFIIAMVVSVAFYFILLNPISLSSASVFKYTTAVLPTFLVAAVVYYAAAKIIVIPSGMGGYPSIPKAPVAKRKAIEELVGRI